MKSRWLCATLMSLATTFVSGCKRDDARQASSMLEDEGHVATAEDKAMGHGSKPAPFPAEPFASTKPGEQEASAMAEDLERSRPGEPEGQSKLEEPRGAEGTAQR